ncbi:MAG: hypothetical protein J6A90_01740 [Clostridia bacterium]|nr:hypothetical protein [Clostridia bacterium]
MKLKLIFRIVSAVMLVAAICFLAVALTHPELGTVFYIFGIPIGTEVWYACYIFYLITMVSLFVVSFFIKSKRKK